MASRSATQTWGWSCLYCDLPEILGWLWYNCLDPLLGAGGSQCVVVMAACHCYSLWSWWWWSDTCDWLSRGYDCSTHYHVTSKYCCEDFSAIALTICSIIVICCLIVILLSVAVFRMLTGNCCVILPFQCLRSLLIVHSFVLLFSAWSFQSPNCSFVYSWHLCHEICDE